jgi:hypothetical protein
MAKNTAKMGFAAFFTESARKFYRRAGIIGGKRLCTLE